MRPARRKEYDQQIAAPIRNQKSGHCRNARQNESLGHELSQKPPPPGADRQPNGHFVPPPERTRKQQIADIRTGNEKNEEHHGERDPKYRKQIAGRVEWGFPKRKQFDAPSAIGCYIFILHAVRNRGDLRLPLFQTDSRLQTGKAFNPKTASIFQLISARHESFLHRYRHPELNRPADKCAIETFGRNTDNRVWQAVEELHSADDVRVSAETLFPHPIADHRDRMRITSVILAALKASPENGVHSERFKIIG